jgi:nucleotide-binding universal stress UspA family protein
MARPERSRTPKEGTLRDAVPSGPILIGYDGSPAADHALREAAALLGPRSALVVVVWEAGASYATLEGPEIPAAPIDLRTAALADQALYEGARQMANSGARLAAEVGFEAESLTVADEVTVGKTLVQLAHERDAQAIVVGAHGHSRLEKLFIGSTSRHVVEHAPCPVLVVRPPGA